MDKIENNYPYEDLQDPKSQIRLLELLPSMSGDMIAAKLFHHNLSESLEYHALSYTWGDPSITTAIALDDDTDFRIPAKLEVALRDLRLPHQSRIIWVDAIPIKQRNNAERNHQVQIMRRQSMSKPRHPSFTKLQALTLESKVEELGDDPAFWKSISGIGEQRYWTRLWIQQEVAYAKRLSIHCRANEVSVASLVNYQRLVREKAFAEVTLLHTEWIRLQNHFMQLPTACEPVDPWTGEHAKVRKFRNILYALDQSRHLGAIDARDRVFGLLGLVEDLQDGDVPIDYALSVKDTYCNVIRYVLQQYQILTFLLGMSLGDSNPEHDLPSWIPDWSQTSLGQVRVSAQEFGSLCNSDTAFSKAPQILQDRSLLLVTGIKIDKVETVYSDMIWRTETPATCWLRTWTSILQKLESTCSEAGKGDEQNTQNNDSESIHFRNLVRTMLTASTEQELADADEHSPVLRFMYKVTLSELEKERPWEGNEDLLDKPPMRLWTRLTEMMIVATLGRYLFVSEQHDLGLGPASTRLEDEISVIYRYPRPMILRACEDK